MLRIHLFGNLRAFDGDGVLPSPHPPKLLALWAYLLLRREPLIPRDQVAFTLWPDVPEAEARANLRRHLHLLHRYLPSAPADRPWVLANRQTIHWNPAADYWLDVQEFEGQCSRLAVWPAEYPIERRILDLEQIANLYRGDLLENLYEDWVLVEREALHQQFLQVLEQLSVLQATSNDLRRAITTVQRLLAQDPLREETHRLMMGLHYLAGDRAAALRQFDACQRTLCEELDVAPMLETLALYQAIKELQPPELVFQRLHADLPGTLRHFRQPPETPPEPVGGPIEGTLEATSNPLPGTLWVPLTSFIGREREVAEVKRLLTHGTQAVPALGASGCRLLTLTGSGGCGKTRLALQVAAELQDAYADGVGWVELATLGDPAFVSQAVASALGVYEEPKRPLPATLADSLRARQTLLVLDNCEHLVEACAELADTLLRACPKLHVLATSREPLRVAGELTWRVPSLTLPDGVPDLRPREKERGREGEGEIVPLSQGGEADLVPTLMQFEAVHLFVERARFSQPGFALTNQNAQAVVQICRRLDGIPLAIELAAARVRILPLVQIAARLDDCFRLLTAGGRTAPRRHQTLRATIDWSYDLLGEAEQGLFNRLSVFAGGFTLEAAEAICAGAAPRAAPSGYPLWVPLRPLDKLGTSQAGVVSSSNHQDGALTGPGIDRNEILDLLSRLVDKSLVAVEQKADASVRYRLLEALRQYGWQRLTARGEVPALERRHAVYYLALVEATDLSRPEQATLNQLAMEHDNLRAALRWCLESGEAETGLCLGGVLWRFWYLRGHYREGREWLTRLLARVETSRGTAAWAAAPRATPSGYPLWVPLSGCLHGAGAMAWAQGDYAAARSLLEESLTIRRESGDRLGMADALNKLGTVTYSQGDHPAARALYEESLAIRRELGDRLGIAGSLHNLGLVAHDQGDYTAARSFYTESLALFRELGDREGTANALLNLATVAYDQGDYAAAHALLEENLAIRRELEHWLGIAYSLELFVGLAVVQSQPARAVLLAGAAAALRKAIGAPLPPVEQAKLTRHLEMARQALSEDAWVAAWAEGQAMPLEQALACALEEVA